MVDAAPEIIRKYGIAHTTLRHISRKLEGLVAATNGNFPGLEDLLAIVNHTIEQIQIKPLTGESEEA